jgi:hypothetical protein
MSIAKVELVAILKLMCNVKDRLLLGSCFPFLKKFILVFFFWDLGKVVCFCLPKFVQKLT